MSHSRHPDNILVRFTVERGGKNCDRFGVSCKRALKIVQGGTAVSEQRERNCKLGGGSRNVHQVSTEIGSFTRCSERFLMSVKPGEIICNVPRPEAEQLCTSALVNDKQP
jgi:hypothetical protein